MALNIIQGVIPNIIVWGVGIIFAIISVYTFVTTLNLRNAIIFAVISAIAFALLLIDSIIYYITSNTNLMIVLMFVAVIVLIVLNAKPKGRKKK